MDQQRRGIWLGVGAYVIWGLSPIYWNLIDDVPEAEMLANRVVWAAVMLAAVLTLRRRWVALAHRFSSLPTVVLAVLGALMLVTNWGVFIWAVVNEHILDISLGYFITPLVSVALGVIILREHLRKAQWLAVSVAALGVLVMTVALGTLPWVSLLLAFAFGFYGLLKKNPRAAPALEGLFGEVTIVAIPGALLMASALAAGESSLTTSPTTALWLVGTGAITMVPLFLFGASAQLIPLSTVGVLQYLAPILHLLVGVLIYHEPLGGPQLIGFVSVWIALAVFTRDQLKEAKRREKGSRISS